MSTVFLFRLISNHRLIVAAVLPKLVVLFSSQQMSSSHRGEPPRLHMGRRLSPATGHQQPQQSGHPHLAGRSQRRGAGGAAKAAPESQAVIGGRRRPPRTEGDMAKVPPASQHQGWELRYRVTNTKMVIFYFLLGGRWFNDLSRLVFWIAIKAYVLRTTVSRIPFLAFRPHILWKWHPQVT